MRGEDISSQAARLRLRANSRWDACVFVFMCAEDDAAKTVRKPIKTEEAKTRGLKHRRRVEVKRCDIMILRHGDNRYKMREEKQKG